MQKSAWKRLEYASLIVLVSVAAAGWLYVFYNQKRSHDPIEIVKKHFVFYPEYSHGVWREAACPPVNGDKCEDVTYSISLNGCGPVTFDWRVFPGDDKDAAWSYKGPTPKFDENKYPLYAVLSADSRLIDSPALGKPLPQSCASN